MKVVMREGTAGLGDAFVELPRAIYAEDPLWIPEEEESLRRAFSAVNPWFASGSAVTMCIPGRARLAVFRQQGCIIEGRQAAWFGYFEAMNDPDAADALLTEAAAWADARGAEVLFGPIDFNTFGRYRVRVSAEPDAMPFPGEPYNPAYYDALLKSAGFTVAREYVTQIGAIKAPPLEAKRAAAKAVADAGYTLEPLDGAAWLALLPELHRKADEIFADSFAYMPLSYDRFAAGYGASVARRLCARTSVAARDAEGELAGFFLVYPHYGPLAVQGSRLGRVDASALSYDEHDSVLAAAGGSMARTAVGKTVGVCPAHRGRGLMAALGAAVIDRGVGRYDRWIGAMIRADNPSRRFGADHMDVERGYALYEQTLDDRPRRGGGNVGR